MDERNASSLWTPGAGLITRRSTRKSTDRSALQELRSLPTTRSTVRSMAWLSSHRTSKSVERLDHDWLDIVHDSLERLREAFEHLQAEKSALIEENCTLRARSADDDTKGGNSPRSSRLFSENRTPRTSRLSSNTSRTLRTRDLAVEVVNGGLGTDAMPPQRGHRMSVPLMTDMSSFDAGEDGPTYAASDWGDDDDDDDEIFPEWQFKLAENNHRAFKSLEPEPPASDCGVLHPVGWIRISWDLVAMGFVLLEFWADPFAIVFLPEGSTPYYISFFWMCSTLYFVADIILNFNTGFVDENTQDIIMQRGLITQRYLTSFFFIDLITALPLDFGMFRFLRKVTRLVRLVRFFRIVRAPRLLESIQRNFGADATWRKCLVPTLMLLILLSLAHLHACVLAAIQPDRPNIATVEESYVWYFECVWQSFLELTSGRVVHANSPPLWAFGMVLAAERIVLFMLASMWLVVQALSFFEKDAKFDLVIDNALKYLRERGVGYNMQAQVLQQLQEASRTKSHLGLFNTWMAEDIPMNLRRSISEELWLHRLKTFGIVDAVIQWSNNIAAELVLIVREETLVNQGLLFAEDEFSDNAYFIVEGRIAAQCSYASKEYPDFTSGMWVGEKAIVNPRLRRTITTHGRATSTLMVLPGSDFQELLAEFRLKQRFQDFCVQHLWQGVCGRCGVVGDHFAHECPLLFPRPIRATLLYSETSMCSHSCVQVETPQPPREGYALTSIDPGSERGGGFRGLKELKRFLRANKLMALLPTLRQLGVETLQDVEDLDSADLERALRVWITAQKMEQSKRAALLQRLSPQAVQAFRDSVRHRFAIFGSRSQHLIFLSHYKASAGTEAALMRAEMEHLIAVHPSFQAVTFEVPVFLDSEDLSDLGRLQENVRKSHNLVLILTEGVLKRPWVMVEVVTAVSSGVPVIPVQVKKEGQVFAFFNEDFYKQLHQGKVLDKSGMEVLHTCKVTLADVERALRKVFNRIALPFSPHGSAALRRTELLAILSKCEVFGDV